MNKKYIGVKIISAIVMCLQDAEIKLGREISSDKKPTDKPIMGYLVEYGDGYQSWSPKDVFEKAYRPVDAMNLGLAIEAMKQGKKVCRAGWNGKGLGLRLQVPDAHSKMTLPYIYMEYPSTPASETAPTNHINAKVPWLASQTDMLAEDWIILEGL